MEQTTQYINETLGTEIKVMLITIAECINKSVPQSDYPGKSFDLEYI